MLTIIRTQESVGVTAEVASWVPEWGFSFLEAFEESGVCALVNIKTGQTTGIPNICVRIREVFACPFILGPSFGGKGISINLGDEGRRRFEMVGHVPIGNDPVAAGRRAAELCLEWVVSALPKGFKIAIVGQTDVTNSNYEHILPPDGSFVVVPNVFGEKVWVTGGGDGNTIQTNEGRRYSLSMEGLSPAEAVVNYMQYPGRWLAN